VNPVRNLWGFLLEKVNIVFLFNIIIRIEL